MHKIMRLPEIYSNLKAGTASCLRLLLSFSLLLPAFLSYRLPQAYAAAPQIINFQGRLTDANNNPESGPFNMSFAVYDALTGGNQLWTEDQTAANGHSVSVANGVFSVQLGAVQAIPETVFSGANAYLEVKVGAETLSPRQRLVSAPYALNSQSSENSLKLGGVDANLFALKSYVDGLLGGGSNPTFASLSVTGNVGIGTTIPSAKLDVIGSIAANAGYLYTGDGSNGVVAARQGSLFVVSNGAGAVVVNANGNYLYPGQVGGQGGTGGLSVHSGGASSSQQAQIGGLGNTWFNSGNVGIGTTNPNSKLYVSGNPAGQWTGRFVSGQTAGDAYGLKVEAGTNSSDNAFVVKNAADTANYFSVRGDGSVGIGTASPGAKLDVNGNVWAYPKPGIGDFTSAVFSNNANATVRFRHAAGTTRIHTDPGQGISLATNGENDRINITSGGNVGIGTTNPSANLDVLGHVAANAGYLYTGDGSNGVVAARQGSLFAVSNGAGAVLINANGNYLYPGQVGGQGGTGGLSVFSGGASSVQQAQIGGTGNTWFNSGNVGIGTTVPGTKLDVAGAVRIANDLTVGGNVNAAANTNIGTHASYGSGYSAFWRTGADYSVLTDGTNTFLNAPAGAGTIYFRAANATGMSLTSTNLTVGGNVNATAFFYTSDERMKKNIKPISGLDIVTKLQGTTFDWKDSGEASAGLIAQEVEKVLPEAVGMNKATGMRNLNYAVLAAPMIESIKELEQENLKENRRIQELESQIEELKNEIRRLRDSRASK